MPRSDNKSHKVWVAVAVKLMDLDSLRARKRSGDPTDIGGRYISILTGPDLRSEEPIQNPGNGRFDCTLKVTAQFHLEGTRELQMATAGVSKAAGPFDQEIRSAIYKDGFWAGAAYPDEKGGILDTQLCVSGAPEHGARLIGAARREVIGELGFAEELGFTVELRPEGIPAQRVRGVTHHLFMAEVR